MTANRSFWDNYSNEHQPCPRGSRAQPHKWRAYEVAFDSKLVTKQLCERCGAERKYKDPMEPGSTAWDPL